MPRTLAVAAVLAGSLTLAACGGSSDDSASTSSAAPTTAVPSAVASAPLTTTAAAASGKAATLDGVTVANPTDLKSKPQVTSSSTKMPTTLEYKDLVVGSGAAATPASTVNVQYLGFLYKDGQAFDSSWDRGGPTSFPLDQVVPGFTQGIGGTAEIPPMKAGGRRIMILPPALGYPDGTPDGSIPPNTPIVFVVDLVSVA